MRYLREMQSRVAQLQISPLFSGGKGRDLARAARLGLKIPKTFGVDPTELRSWLESIPHYPEAIQSWRAWSADLSEAVPRSMSDFLTALLSQPMPSSWNFADSKSAWIARSSMNIENHPESSFAGAFVSAKVLKPDAASLWQAFLQVVSSGYSRESMSQVLSSGFDPRDFQPGVIFQPFIGAQFSGVAFSHDPQNLWRHCGLMEWGSGDGEGVVQGTKKTYNASRDTPEANPLTAVFTDKLWRAVDRLEKEFGRPVDIEWCWDGSDFWVLQVRPIAGPESEIISLSRGEIRWTRDMAEERFPQPITLLGWTAIDDLVTSNIHSLKKDFGIEVKSSTPLAIRYRGFVYSDPDFFKFPHRIRIHFGLYINPFRARSWRLCFTILNSLWKRVFTTKKTTVSRALFRMRSLVGFIGTQARASHHAWDNHVRVNRERIQSFSSRHFSADRLLQDLEELRQLSIDFLEPDLAIFVVKDTFNQALEKLWVATAHPAHELSWMLSSFEDNRSLQMGGEWASLMWALSEDARVAEFLSALEKSDANADQVLGGEARSRWSEFLSKHGHTRTGWDIALSSWRDDPRLLVPILKSTLNLRESKKISAPTAPSIQKVEKFLTELESFHLTKSEIQWVRGFIQTQQDFMQMDEELRFLSGLLLEPSRKLVMLAGEVLVAKKVISAREDVFFLRLDELKTSLRDPELNRYALIRKRQSESSRWKNEKAIQELPFRKLALKETVFLGNGVLRFTSASPGKASGPAFFLEHMEDAASLPEGAILITTAPNPAYVPLYPLLAGIITTSGGPLSHGFVAAREYGIPAISGWSAEQKSIQSGQWIEIDGSLGTLKLGEMPSS